jgi:ubiquitin carboxyl-terminal hydrolase 10
VNNVIEQPSSSNPTTTSEIGATSHGPDMTPPINPVYSGSRPTCASPTAVVATASQDITSTATLSHPPEGSEQHDSDIVAPSATPRTSQILSTASTPTPTPPIPTSLPKTPSESYDAGVASVSYSSHFAPLSIRVGSSIPASRPTSSATLPRLRARGLVNTTNICFANAILQLLVNLPPFWNLFRELGDLKGQHGARVSETGGGATPLVDATVRFFKEFTVEESPSTQQQSQPATAGTSRADSFEPTYMYDAMKEKRQLKPLLVRSRDHVAASCF